MSNRQHRYPYIAFIRSLSQSWAIYCLVLFYLALKKQPMESEGYLLFQKLKPIPKFLVCDLNVNTRSSLISITDSVISVFDNIFS